MFSKEGRSKNKRAQRALGRSPEEKVNGQGEAIILLKPNIGRELLDDAIYIPNLKSSGPCSFRQDF